MRLRHIEIFHAVYSNNSISNAARLLNVSQPSVSKVLRHAEDQLGYLLFDRIKGKLVPTNEGRQLYEEVSKLYTNLHSIRQLSESLGRMETGVVRIAATPGLGLKVIPEAVATFMLSHPNIKFDIETLHHGEIIQSLRERKVDIGVAFDPSSHPEIHERIVGAGEFVCLAPNDEILPDKPRMALSDIEGKNFISLNSGGPLGQLLMAQVEASGVQLNTVANVETYHVAKTLVSLGVGFAVVDEITARSNPAEIVQMKRMTPKIQFNVTALLFEAEPVPLICHEFLHQLEKTLKTFLGD